ncbi:hypothetical protein FLONG3_6415 [Fusarium longipes]|uniref:Uncharacterized protein n=1 Tax=Fusarium longipes TaxID=694270 RepID=A0A395SKW9_9HYPO|nr:hypothetical protein FLONG3_6415 [Fusarium longipes]
MANAADKIGLDRIKLGDDMDDFNLVLNPARRVKPVDQVGTQERKKKQETDQYTPFKGDVVGKPSNQKSETKTKDVPKPPTAAMKKALDDYHTDMRKLAEDSMPIRHGLRVPCEDWFCSDRGSARFDLNTEP